MPKKKHRTISSMFYDQERRFADVRRLGQDGLHEMATAGLEHLNSLVTGASPSGKDRIKALRAAGHPYGRYDTPHDKNGVRFGSKRGIKGKTGKEAIGTFKQLPIGTISGQLKSATFASVSGFKLTLGFNSKAGPSIYSVVPFGTNKMVGRGLWLPKEGGALGKRMKMLRLAYRKTFFDPLRKP